jgi:secreted trypsin-like serine protease
MRSRTINIALLSLVFIVSFSGIIRHDVDEKKYVKLARAKQFNCVGQIFIDSIAGGSCVLINNRFILSAAHCFIDSDTREDSMEMNGHPIVTFIPYNQRVTDTSKLYVIFKEQKVRIKNLMIHPNYFDDLNEGWCDIALLELERPIDNIIPANLNTAFDELNSTVVGVGFGISGVGNRPDLISELHKKIAGENVVDSLTGKKYNGSETLLMCDFDHPTRNDCNKLGSAKPKPLEYICSGGDSGGGLFRLKNNRWELIGICSSSGVDIEQMIKTGYYGQIMHWTRVSPFMNWINEQIKN